MTSLSPPVTSAPSAPDPSPALWVEAWNDPVLDQLGYDARSSYVDTFWLSILGPSTTWLLRRLSSVLEDSPEGIHVNCSDLAVELGLGPGTGRRSTFMRSIDRAEKFTMARRAGETLYVRRRIPPLARRQVQRLPERLQRLHDSWEDTPTPAADDQHESIRRARRLALTLFELGEDATTAEHQLQAWNFHPSISWDATNWALERHAQARQAALLADGAQ